MLRARFLASLGMTVERKFLHRPMKTPLAAVRVLAAPPVQTALAGELFPVRPISHVGIKLK